MSADKIFEELGYEKKEYGIFVDYLKEDQHIEFRSDDKTFNKNQEKELAGEITMAELKAINTKVKELGWE